MVAAPPKGGLAGPGMDWYLLLLEKYGYLAIFLGTLLEGEFFLTLGGVLARQGHMTLPAVIFLAVAGSFLSHALFFYLGRWRGLSLIQRFPRLEANYPKAHALAERFGPLCILIVQFLYGMRLITCLVLGVLRLRVRAFVFWQLLSCCIWALVLAGSGYLCWPAVEYCLLNRHLYVPVLIGVGFLLVLGYRCLWRWTDRQVNGPPASPAALSYRSQANPGNPKNILEKSES